MKKNTSMAPIATSDPKQQLGTIPKESLMSIDNADNIELQRREAYIEPLTRDLLREILECCDNIEMLPKFVQGAGFIYQAKQTYDSQAKTIQKDVLDNLVRLDILKKQFHDSVSVCPYCESTTITFHSRCPKCKSHIIQKTSLTEHIPCGYIDQRDKYVGNQCPKCGQALVEGQYRNMGRWFLCQECGERFENPESDLICRTCQKNFTIKDAKILDIPKYSLNAQRKKEIRQNVASLESVKKLLIDLGFSVEIPGIVIGQKSGMQHHFSLIARKSIDGKEKTIALDHAVSETEVTTSPIILYIYKISEVNVDLPIFVALPQLNETARKIAQGHSILLIEGSTEEKEAMDKITGQIKLSLNSSMIAPAPIETPETEKKSFLNRFVGKKKP
jgi:predicted RNA-binding Zn-ribbon protein involved in translation (DUF1610 family)